LCSEALLLLPFFDMIGLFVGLLVGWLVGNSCSILVQFLFLFFYFFGMGLPFAIAQHNHNDAMVVDGWMDCSVRFGSSFVRRLFVLLFFYRSG